MPAGMGTTMTTDAQGSTSPGVLYGVLDAARDDRIYDRMMTLAPDASCLFSDPIPDDIRRAAPHVMRMPPDGALLAWWRAEGRDQFWGFACEADCDLRSLRLHLKKSLQAHLPDGSVVMFRFWDPRVLTPYVPSLTAEERLAFFGPIRTIYAERLTFHRGVGGDRSS